MTLTAKNELINNAMAHLGEPGFTAVDTDPPGAALAKVLGQLDGPGGARRTALAQHPWLFSLRYAALSPAARNGNWKWSKVFDLPATFVKMWHVEGDDVAFEVGTELVSGQMKRVIRSDEAALNVCYAEDVPYEADDPQFSNYLGLLLAARTAGPLKSDYDGAKRLAMAAKDALFEAMGGEAGQHRDQEALFSSGFAELRAQVA